MEDPMKIFGKTASEYVAFSKSFLILIVVVGIVRLALSLGGVPNSTAKWFSITGVALIGVFYFAVRVHTSGFGSYKHLLPIYVLQGIAAQAVIIPAIVLAILTGTDNIFSAPEYSGGGDGKTWFHAGAHLVFGTVIGPLVTWLVGCVVMFATKKVVPGGKSTKAAARA
jgi:hypothetical protein